MAISKNVLSNVGPTTQRIQFEDCHVETTSAVPPQQSVSVINGVTTITDHSPQREGQVIVYNDGSGLVQVYIAVKTNDSLNEPFEWKKVKIVTEFIDPTTGQPFSSL